MSGVSFSQDVIGRRHIEALNAVDFMPIRFLPVDPRRFDVGLKGHLGVSFHVWSTRSRSGFKTQPVKPREVLTLRLPLQGGMRWKDNRRDYAVGFGQGFLLPFESFAEFEAGSDFEVLSCTVECGRMADCYRSLGFEEDFDIYQFEPVVNFDTAPLRALLASLQRLFSMIQPDSEHSDLTSPLVEEVFLYQLISAWPRASFFDKHSKQASSTRTARTARDYIKAHLGRRLMLDDIALASRVSVRTLQDSFRQEFGQTPTDYILNTRLDRVKADLLAEPHLSITAIAQRWGFTHLSDFSRRYRHRFGCSPRQSRSG